MHLLANMSLPIQPMPNAGLRWYGAIWFGSPACMQWEVLPVKQKVFGQVLNMITMPLKRLKSFIPYTHHVCMYFYSGPQTES